MFEQECPLAEGDRVDHKIFGLGTVIGAPVKAMGPDMKSPKGFREAGWRIDVKWDDSDRTASSVMSFALRKVSSPDIRPFMYWDRQWQPLLQAWLNARREVERLSSTFRPLPDPAQIDLAFELEAAAYQAMQGFWREEMGRVESERAG